MPRLTMVRFRPTRPLRRLALLAAILFAALTFVASGPHHHLLRSAIAASTRVAHAGLAASVSAAADNAPAAFREAGPRLEIACPLCDWLAASSRPSVVAAALFVPLTMTLDPPYSRYAEPRCNLPLPMLGLRAPPAPATV